MIAEPTVGAPRPSAVIPRCWGGGGVTAMCSGKCEVLPFSMCLWSGLENLSPMPTTKIHGDLSAWRSRSRYLQTSFSTHSRSSNSRLARYYLQVCMAVYVFCRSWPRQFYVLTTPPLPLSPWSSDKSSMLCYPEDLANPCG